MDGLDGDSLCAGHDYDGTDCRDVAMLMPAEVAFAQTYWHNPYFRRGMRAEQTLIEALDVRRELRRLGGRAQFILQAQAAGFSQKRMAEMCGVSQRTMVRWMTEFTEQRRAA